ncbi:hypothetical protein AB8A05_03945 [Tardiphaga sp. 538_B7_N1_4]|uniref:hypothetical protein n=1 Tax=Tardiphaga sp. 538_B7_N1_4 TaxID=3240778 RepID=UPI003F2587F8
MTKRQPDEFNRIGQDTSHAESQLRAMEDAAIAGTKGNAKVFPDSFGGKWLSVFCKDGALCYNWQGGYPTSDVSREAAVSVLAFR